MRGEVSESEIDSTFDKVRALVRAKQFDSALELCNRLLSEWPEKDRHHLFGRIAYIHSRMGNKRAALDSVTQALERDQTSAAHWDQRMILAVEVGDYQLAVSDSTFLIELEERRGSVAFVESARVYRAYALIQQGEIERALSDLSKVKDGGPFRIAGKWWLKSELVNLAQPRS